MAKSTQSKLDRDRDMPVFKSGIKEGRLQMRQEVLTFLEEKYMNEDLVLDTVESEAILALAKELSEFTRAL